MRRALLLHPEQKVPRRGLLAPDPGDMTSPASQGSALLGPAFAPSRDLNCQPHWLESTASFPILRPKNIRRLQVLTRREARVAHALAETMFPTQKGMPSVEEAQVVEYLDDLLSYLALKEQVLIRGLLLLLETQCLAFNGLRPKLFSQATPEERFRNLAGWEKSKIFQRRIVFMAIRTLLLWAYVDSTEVERDMGYDSGTAATARRNRARARAATALSELQSTPTPLERTS